MLPRERRVTQTSEIMAVFKRGRRFSIGPVVCSHLAKPGSMSRATVIVSKKVSKLAVTRNLLKRRARAVLERDSWAAGALVVQLHPSAKDESFAELQAQLKTCLRRLR
jgi:ribonuclease P protein component